jgi:hypothetical protein
MAVLVTFSGKHGDAIWAAQSARALALTGVEVDFAMMPRYSAIQPLLKIQPYIRDAFPLPGWEQQHDMWGAQPRIPPWVPDGYDAVHHLTYDQHPREPLVMWGLNRLGLPMPEPPVPFLFAPSEREPHLVTYAFNGGQRAQKENLLALIRVSVPRARFECVEHIPFDAAARRINAADWFFGCRSANYVVAMGLGKRCLTIEPDGGRRSTVFGFPAAIEHMPDPTYVHQFVDLANQWTEP